MRRPAVLLLDAGNTLVYLDHDALADVLRRQGLALRARDLQEREGLAKRRYARGLRRGLDHADGWDLFMRELLLLAGATEQEARAGAAAARRAHDAFNLWRRVPTGLPEALERVRAAGTRLAVVSNSEGQLPALFRRVGLDGLFECVVDSHLEGVSKPSPEIFRRALARLGAEPGDALYAGDIPDVDVLGARAAGMEAVLIDTLDHYPDYRDAPRFRSLVELVDALGY